MLLLADPEQIAGPIRPHCTSDLSLEPLPPCASPRFHPLMSSGVDVRRRPGIWSYFSFGSSSQPRRRTSVSAVGGNSRDPVDRDSFDKPARHYSHYRVASNSSPSLMNEYKVTNMTQGQRTRYMKAGGLIAFILFILFFISPGRYVSGSFRQCLPLISDESNI